MVTPVSRRTDGPGERSLGRAFGDTLTDVGGAGGIVDDAYPDCDGDGSPAEELDLSDVEVAGAQRVSQRPIGEEAMDEIEQRIVVCKKCGEHKLAPPGFARLYTDVRPSLKFECARLFEECRHHLKPRGRGRGARSGSGSARARGSLRQAADAKRAGQGREGGTVDATVGSAPPATHRAAAESEPARRSGRPPSTISRRRAVGPVRLPNLGKTCFANALVQLLRRSLDDSFSSSPGNCPLKVVLQDSSAPASWPLWRFFPRREQQDACEVLEHLLQRDHALHAACGEDCLVPRVLGKAGFSSTHYRRCFGCAAAEPEQQDDAILKLQQDASVQGALLSAQLPDWQVLGHEFQCTQCQERGHGGLSKVEAEHTPGILSGRQSLLWKLGLLQKLMLYFSGNVTSSSVSSTIKAPIPTRAIARRPCSRTMPAGTAMTERLGSFQGNAFALRMFSWLLTGACRVVRLQGQLQERRTFLIWSELARVLSVVLVVVVVAVVIVSCVYNSRQVWFNRF